jgi:hypothetical protein
MFCLFSTVSAADGDNVPGKKPAPPRVDVPNPEPPLADDGGGGGGGGVDDGAGDARDPVLGEKPGGGKPGKLGKPGPPRIAAKSPPVLLGTSRKFVILTKAGVSSVPPSVITGNVGVSPIAAAAMTGFGLTMDSSNNFSQSAQVTGKCFGADYASPTPSMLTTAISDMEAAYTDAAGRPPTSGAHIDVGGGLITGMTLTAGVYTWGTDINFASDIYLKGSSKDNFLLQSTGNVIVGSGAKVIFINDGSNGRDDPGPSAANVVWQVAGYVDAGTTSALKGTFLVKTHAVFKTGASLLGRVLSQTACTLDSAVITASVRQGPPPVV